MQPGASQPCAVFPGQRPVEDKQLQHQQQSTDAGPTFGITVQTMSGYRFPFDVPVTQTLCQLKERITSEINAKFNSRSSDLAIVFQSQLIDGAGSERRVIDFGIGDGSVLEVVRRNQNVELEIVVDYYVQEDIWPPEKSEFSFPFPVSRNLPCAMQIKAEVMEICEEEFASELLGMPKMTNPHLFLKNYELPRHAVISLGDDWTIGDHCLDDLVHAFNPYEVYVVDQAQCRCETCDMSWMLLGWHCPQVWHTASTGWSDSSSGPL